MLENWDSTTFWPVRAKNPLKEKANLAPATGNGTGHPGCLVIPTPPANKDVHLENLILALDGPWQCPSKDTHENLPNTSGIFLPGGTQWPNENSTSESDSFWPRRRSCSPPHLDCQGHENTPGPWHAPPSSRPLNCTLANSGLDQQPLTQSSWCPVLSLVLPCGVPNQPSHQCLAGTMKENSARTEKNWKLRP